MDGYVVLMACGVGAALVGIGGAAGLFSFSLGSHKEFEHPEAIWRSANKRAGLGVVVYAALMGVGALIARSQTPDLDSVVGVALTVGALIPLLGAWSALRLLQESKREQRKGRLI